MSIIQNLSYLPTQMTRTSPFFIMNRKQMQNRPTERIVIENSWGRVSVEGERLSVNDETYLLFLLYYFTYTKKNKVSKIWFTRYELCKIVGIQPHTDTYKAIINSIERLSTTNILIEIKNKNKEYEPLMEGTILLANLRVYRGGRMRFNIEINPYILQMAEKGSITRLDLNLRSKLKGDISRALYRFYNSQRDFYSEPGEYECYLLTLCKAINLNLDCGRLWRLRARIRSGLDELERVGFLKWRITQKDYVKVVREMWNKFDI